MGKKAKKSRKNKAMKVDRAEQALAQETLGALSEPEPETVAPQEAAKPAEEKKAPAPKTAAKAPAAKAGPAKKPGRKPMTEEQKAEAKRLREEKKAAGVKTSVYLQFKGMEDNVDELIEAVRADYRAAHRRKPITDVKLYIKPEEYTVYYVVNGTHFGKVGM